MKPVHHDPEAQTDLFTAARRYEDQQEGLGSRFLLAVDEAVQKIAESPTTFGYYEKPVRSCRAGTFPYRVLYVDEPETIWILAIAHLSRRPGWWRYRLGS